MIPLFLTKSCFLLGTSCALWQSKVMAALRQGDLRLVKIKNQKRLGLSGIHPSTGRFSWRAGMKGDIQLTIMVCPPPPTYIFQGFCHKLLRIWQKHVRTVVHRFSWKFGKFEATNCGSPALLKIDLVGNLHIIENFDIAYFSTKSALHWSSL